MYDTLDQCALSVTISNEPQTERSRVGAVCANQTLSRQIYEIYIYLLITISVNIFPANDSKMTPDSRPTWDYLNWNKNMEVKRLISCTSLFLIYLICTQELK